MAGKSEKITKRVVDAAGPEPKLYRVWDTELKGFGLKVMPSGVKTYIVVYRPYGGGRRQPVKEFTIGRHGALTPDEARREALRRLAEVQAGGNPQESRLQLRQELTVSELCDQYMAEGTGTKKASTLRSDLARINCHIKPLIGNLKVSRVNRQDVARMMRDVATGKTAAVHDGKRKRTDSMARGGQGTASRTVGLLGGIFTYAVRAGLRSDNPVHGVERYKDRQSQRYLSGEELGRLGAALAGVAGHAQGVAVIRLLILTGARKGEIEGLRWAEVDFGQSCLWLGDSKTGQKMIPLGSPALLVLKEVARHPQSDFVFPGRGKSGEVSGHFVGTPKVWKEVCEAAGLAGVRLHDLRHTFASLAAGGGQSLPIIGKILGHSDVKTTARYAHLADDPLKIAANRTAEAAAAALAGKTAEVVPFTSKSKA